MRLPFLLFENLIPLCIHCHRNEPFHHLFISHEKTVRILQLRNQQKMVNCWKDVYHFSDPALHNVIDLLERQKTILPQVGWQLKDETENITACLELGWPAHKKAIVISRETAVIARKYGWEAWSMRNCLQHTSQMIQRLPVSQRTGFGYHPGSTSFYPGTIP